MCPAALLETVRAQALSTIFQPQSYQHATLLRSAQNNIVAVRGQRSRGRLGRFTLVYVQMIERLFECPDDVPWLELILNRSEWKS